MNDKPTETHPYTMNTDHTEVYIASLEKEIALERKNVEGSDQHPNFGEDFADLLFVTRQLKNRLDEANQHLSLLTAQVKVLKVDSPVSENNNE